MGRAGFEPATLGLKAPSGACSAELDSAWILGLGLSHLDRDRWVMLPPCCPARVRAAWVSAARSAQRGGAVGANRAFLTLSLLDVSPRQEGDRQVRGRMVAGRWLGIERPVSLRLDELVATDSAGRHASPVDRCGYLPREVFFCVASASRMTSSPSEQPTSGASSQPPKAPLSCACTHADSNEPGLVEKLRSAWQRAGTEGLDGLGRQRGRRLRTSSGRRMPSDGAPPSAKTCTRLPTRTRTSSRAITTPSDMQSSPRGRRPVPRPGFVAKGE